MNKYLTLVKSTSNYARRMNRLSNQIFGGIMRDTSKSSVKVVKMFSEKPIELRDEIVNYYPRLPEIGKLMARLRKYGLYRDEHQDFKEEMIRYRRIKGKKVEERWKRPPPKVEKNEENEEKS